jgi:hypothetical protein
VTDRRAWNMRSRPSTTLAGPLVIALPNLAGTFRHRPTSSSSRGLTHAQHHGPSHNDREVDRAAGSPINHGEALIRPGASTTRVHAVTHREDGVHQPKDFGLHRARADRRPISTTGGCDDRPPTGTVRTTALAQKRWGRLVS